MNVFDSIAVIGRHYFLYKFIATQKFFAFTMLLRSLKQVFWKKSVFYVRYLQNNITMLLIPKVQLKILLLNFPQQVLFLKMFFYTLSFYVKVSHFSS